MEQKVVIDQGSAGQGSEWRTRARERLVGRQADIVQAWLSALGRCDPTLQDLDELTPRLEQVTDVLIDSLVADTFTPDTVREAAITLQALDALQPKALHLMQEALASSLIASVDQAEALILWPRVAAALWALEAGLFVGKAQRIARFDVSAMSKLSHDLKTPINAITGFSRVILKGIDGPITDLQQEDLTSIFESGRRLLEMINDVFSVARGDAADTRLYPSKFAVSDLLADILRSIAPVMDRYGHRFEIASQSNLGAMEAEAWQVRWVALSLLTFVARLGEHNTIGLNVSRERGEDQDWLVFEVHQKLPGPGIDESVVPGTGSPDNGSLLNKDLGLLSCWRFCQEMGGRLEIAAGDQVLARAYLPAKVEPRRVEPA